MENGHIEYRKYILGDIQLIYLLDRDSGHISMSLLPEGESPVFEERRAKYRHRDLECRAWNVGSLCHLSLRHHPQGNGAGNTLKFGTSTENLQFVRQEAEEDQCQIRISTFLAAEEGYETVHTVTYTKGEHGIEAETEFRNRTGRTVTLDMLTSFSLDNLSPVQRDDAPYKLKLHRFRGGWSLEGKHVEETVEELNLESTWFRGFPESERYGVLGSHPVKRWFPFGCVEDTQHRLFWAAQIGVNSSWQMEFTKDGDCYSLSGGPADCEFGGWWKEIPDGGSFLAPKAYISVSGKNLWDVCQNITGMFQKYADTQPECERALPAIFNEWCSSWGKPTHEGMLRTAKRLSGLPVRYLVIDAGWSKKNCAEAEPQGSNGDWEYDRDKFPHGIGVLAQELRESGFQTGIWFEFEVTTEGAKVHGPEYDSWHLYRGGEIIQTGEDRRFLDFRKKEVREYLDKKVVSFLKENEITYLKVDYNGSIGYGCDGAESPGEGLRAQMEAVYSFFTRLREEVPELVIENCASGGHRLEPKMMGITAMSSFSDAHECPEIPYIAANLHQLILPRQSQIWAVVSPELTMREIRYRLMSAMLGRFCLSGGITELDAEQWEEVVRSLKFYEKVKHIIKDGRTRLYRESTDNQHHLKGAQAVWRSGKSGDVLLVCHSFEAPPEKISGELPPGEWTVECTAGEGRILKLGAGRFEVCFENAWEASAFHLRKNR